MRPVCASMACSATSTMTSTSTSSSARPASFATSARAATPFKRPSSTTRSPMLSRPATLSRTIPGSRASAPTTPMALATRAPSTASTRPSTFSTASISPSRATTISPGTMSRRQGAPRVHAVQESPDRHRVQRLLAGERRRRLGPRQSLRAAGQSGHVPGHGSRFPRPLQTEPVHQSDRELCALLAGVVHVELRECGRAAAFLPAILSRADDDHQRPDRAADRLLLSGSDRQRLRRRQSDHEESGFRLPCSGGARCAAAEAAELDGRLCRPRTAAAPGPVRRRIVQAWPVAPRRPVRRSL